MMQPNEDEESLLAKLGYGSLGGLAWLGETLDKPGRAVRGMLSGLMGGDWGGGLLNLIPFSDTRGITDASKSVSGRDLLETAGILGANTPGFDMGDVAGFGAEVLLDPLSYATLGGSALTKSGKVAKALGVMPEAQYATQLAKPSAISALLRKTVGLSPDPALTPVLKAGEGARELGMTKRLKDVLSTDELKLQAQAIARDMGTDLRTLMAKDEPLSGLLGIGFPFLEPSFVLGTDKTAQSVARFMDTWGDRIRYSGPVRQATALFSRDMREQITKHGQVAAGKLARELEQDAIRGSEIAVGIVRSLDDAGLNPSQRQEVLEYLIEQERLPDEIASKYTPQQIEALQRAAGEMIGMETQTREKIIAAGMPIPYHDYPGLKYGARNVTAPSGLKLFEQRFSAARGRRDDLTDLPRWMIENFNRSPMLVGKGKVSLEDAERIIDETIVKRRMDKNITYSTLGSRTRPEFANEQKLVHEYLGTERWHDLAQLLDVPLNTGVQELRRMGEAHISELQRLIDQPKALAKRFAKMNHDPLKAPAFYQDVIADFAGYMIHGLKTRTATKGLTEFLGTYARMEGGEGYVPLREVIDKATLTKDGKVLSGAIEGIQNAFTKQYGGAKVPIESLHIPADIGDDAVRFIEGFVKPDVAAPILQVVDWYTQLFKAGNTTPFPAFHVRNFASGVWQNLVGGAMGMGSYKLAKSLLSGTGDEKLLKGLREIPGFETGTIEENASKLRDMLYIYNVTGQGRTKDATKGVFRDPQQFFEGQIPGKSGNEMTLSGGISKLSDIWKKDSTFGDRVTAPLRSGQDVGNWVEGLNRAAGFIELLKKGYDPAVAAAKTNAMHVDFNNLSRFERNVMKRAIPFYSWLRGAIPHAVMDIIEHPGGLNAQYARVSGETREGPDAFLPQYLQGGLAVPIGERTAEGRQQFLSQLDLPVETMTDFLHSGPTWITDTLREAAGTFNPLIKAPMEMVSGQQFYSGRDLRDLYSPTGSVPLDQLIMNLPTARTYTTLRKLVDTRHGFLDPAKLINLLTGARITSVDIDTAKNVAARELIQEKLRNDQVGRVFEHMYVPVEDRANLTPDQLQLLELNSMLARAAQKEAREKKKQRELATP